MGEKIPVQLKDVRDVNEFVNILSGFETAKKIAKNSKNFHLIIPYRDLKKG